MGTVHARVRGPGLRDLRAGAAGTRSRLRSGGGPRRGGPAGSAPEAAAMPPADPADLGAGGGCAGKGRDSPKVTPRGRGAERSPRSRLVPAQSHSLSSPRLLFLRPLPASPPRSLSSLPVRASGGTECPLSPARTHRKSRHLLPPPETEPLHASAPLLKRGPPGCVSPGCRRPGGTGMFGASVPSCSPSPSTEDPNTCSVHGSTVRAPESSKLRSVGPSPEDTFPATAAFTYSSALFPSSSPRRERGLPAWVRPPDWDLTDR